MYNLMLYMVSVWQYFIGVVMFRTFLERLDSLMFRFRRASSGRYRYSGSYLDGRASYYYDTDSTGCRVYEGPFRYTKEVYDYSVGKTLYEVKGSFCNNKRNGRWSFSRKNQHGKRILYIDYVNGMQSGCYVYKSDECSNGMLHNSGAAYLSLSMRNGKPVGDVSGCFGKCILTAVFDDAGLPDGKWIMDMSASGACRIDHEIWNHGTLVDAYSVDISTGDRLVPSERIEPFVRSFVYGYCAPLEGLLEKGTDVWHWEVGQN